MHVHLAALARGIDPDAASTWWSDFQEGAHDHSFFPGSRRAIVARGPGHVSMRESAFGIAWENVTAWPGRREVRFVGTNKLSRFSGTYRFEEAGPDTRLVLDADIDLAKPIRWSDRLTKPAVVAMLKADLRGHAKQMERDLRRA